MKDRIFFLTAVLSLALFFIITFWWNSKVSDLGDQQAAKRWSEDGGCAQVSTFMTKEACVDEFQLKGFEKQLETALSEAAVTVENENARLYIDAYSSLGKITVVSSRSTLETDAVGVGGDFFFFHPLQLVSGRYFSGEELMQDFVILDEEAAWQLFGSNDIEGMSVMINGVPHYVAGVIKREKGRLAENAGLQKSVTYVSFQTLSKYGTSEGISCYEIVAPNPIKKFVYSTVKEKFGLKEDEMLPSIRGLAKDLRISFITTKRAYEELEKDGFIYTLPGKGCYVAPKNVELLREENLKKIEEYIDEIVRLATSCNLNKQDIIEMVNFSWEEQE